MDKNYDSLTSQGMRSLSYIRTFLALKSEEIEFVAHHDEDCERVVYNFPRAPGLQGKLLLLHGRPAVEFVLDLPEDYDPALLDSFGCRLDHPKKSGQDLCRGLFEEMNNAGLLSKNVKMTEDGYGIVSDVPLDLMRYARLAACAIVRESTSLILDKNALHSTVNEKTNYSQSAVLAARAAQLYQP